MTFSKMECLLLQSSSIFENCDQYDCIRQSYIDLKFKHSKEEVHDLLIKAQDYLEKCIENNLAEEIFLLILNHR